MAILRILSYRHQRKMCYLLFTLVISTYLLLHNSAAIYEYSDKNEPSPTKYIAKRETLSSLGNNRINKIRLQQTTAIPLLQETTLSRGLPEARPFYPDNSTRQDYFVYVNIEFTESNTLSNIFLSYGYRHMLNMMMGTDGFRELDTTEMEPGISWRVGPDVKHPHVMAQHARYNHEFYQKHFPSNTVYITSIKEPVAWYSLAVKSLVPYRNRTINSVLEDNMQFYKERGFTIAGLTGFVHNSFLEHLGFDVYSSRDIAAIKEYIDFIDKQFNLVMVSEYFDESLVLLKRLMNWSMTDIFYTYAPSLIPKVKYNWKEVAEETLSSKEKEKLLDLDHNLGDWLLYQHFNESFWKKIAKEEKFDEEVSEFRKLRKTVEEFCLNLTREEYPLHLKLQSGKDIEFGEKDCLAIRASHTKEFNQALDEYCPFRKGDTWQRRMNHPHLVMNRQNIQKRMLDEAHLNRHQRDGANIRVLHIKSHH